MITKYGYLKLKERYKSGYRWIARDKDGCLYIYYREPKRLVYSWDTERGCSEWSVNDDLLQCIKWEDEKPTRIDDLIRDYESHQIITSEKVKATVPQFVAEWIENEKQIEDGLSVFDAYDDLKQQAVTYLLKEEIREKSSKVLNWVSRNSNTFIDAWLDGYEIEKEKQYILKFSNGQYLYSCDLGMTDKALGCKLTKAEIEAVDPRLMQFAEEVE